MSSRARGRAVEETVKLWLQERGFRMVAQNFQAGHLEIDLVGLRGQLLVFFEVKSRKTHGPIHPHLALSPAKRRHLTNASRIFLLRHPGFQSFYARYDAVFVTAEGGHEQIEHIENAFMASRPYY